LLVASVIIEVYPLTGDPDITLQEIKNSLVVPSILVLLYTVIQIASGELVWLSNTFSSLDGLPLVLLTLLLGIGLAYSISKDKVYFDFAKIVFGSFAGAFAQKKISSKKE